MVSDSLWKRSNILYEDLNAKLSHITFSDENFDLYGTAQYSPLNERVPNTGAPEVLTVLLMFNLVV